MCMYVWYDDGSSTVTRPPPPHTARSSCYMCLLLLRYVWECLSRAQSATCVLCPLLLLYVCPRQRVCSREALPHISRRSRLVEVRELLEVGMWHLGARTELRAHLAPRTEHTSTNLERGDMCGSQCRWLQSLPVGTCRRLPSMCLSICL